MCIDQFAVRLHKGRGEVDLKKLLAMSRHRNVWLKVSELAGTSVEYPFGAAYNRPTLARELALIREEIPFSTASDRARILGLNATRIWNLG